MKKLFLKRIIFSNEKWFHEILWKNEGEEMMRVFIIHIKD